LRQSRSDRAVSRVGRNSSAPESCPRRTYTTHKKAGSRVSRHGPSRAATL
jgi:hypothetical protein